MTDHVGDGLAQAARPAGPEARSLPAAPAPLGEVLALVLRLGILLLRSGTTTFRVRERMRGLARALGVERLDAQISLNGIAATARTDAQSCTMVAENLTLGINAQRLGALEALARAVPPERSVAGVHARLDAIEQTPPLYSVAATAIAVGLACGAFAYFNGGGAAEIGVVAASAIIGQGVRTFLLRRHLNQLAVTALCAFLTAALYGLIATGSAHLAGRVIDDRSGFFSSVLFLIPGFPLVASLLDMIQLEFAAGLTRLGYGVMLVLAGAVGISAVASIMGLAAAAPAASAGPAVATLLLRAIGSFVGGVGFAILYNSVRREAVVVGIMAIAGNCLRLELHDFGLNLAPASFLGALLVGVLATLAAPRVRTPRITLTVPGVILMTPGVLCYDTIVQFAQGDVLAALRSTVLAGFVIGAMAMGLAVARFATDRRWAFET